MPDTVAQIKERLSIVDVVSPYVKLTRSGRYFKGLSPFTKEKTPSFFVNPERGSYYCFSSSQGGDAFTFIEKMEGVDFKGALKILAEKAGVEVVYHGKENKEKKDRLFEIMARAEAYYTRLLDPSGEAYAYALSRGLTKETISAWSLGYAPDSWRGLFEELTAQGFSTEELLSAGLIKEADEKRGTYYDRFRARLMFPIRDTAGRTVAFTGRALKKDDQAKYLNSPETELFKKSEVLFGMHKAKDAIRTRGFALLVEGQFDLVLLHQIGFTNTIALSGTALSSVHLSLIKRYAENLMLALDSDRAGLSASAKNALEALRAGMRVKAVTLPEGKDPADLAHESPEEFTKRVKEAESIIEFFLTVLSRSETDAHRLLLSSERVILPLLRAIKSPMEREHFVGIVARKLSLTPEAIRSSLRAVKEESSFAPVKEGVSTKEEPTNSRENQRLLILATAQTYPDTPLAKHLIDEYARIIGTLPEEETLPERVLFEAGLLYGESPGADSANDLIRAFEKAELSYLLEEATKRLKTAEDSKDEAQIQEALSSCKDLSTRLSRIS